MPLEGAPTLLQALLHLLTLLLPQPRSVRILLVANIQLTRRPLELLARLPHPPHIDLQEAADLVRERSVRVIQTRLLRLARLLEQRAKVFDFALTEVVGAVAQHELQGFESVDHGAE